MTPGPILYPQVTSLPQPSGVGGGDRVSSKDEKTSAEFSQIFDRTLAEVRQPLKFSAHATQRMRDRRIALDSTTLSKVNDAVDKAEAKGVEDTLVLTPDAALIVNVRNRTVITAMDKGALNGNVFTNIDGAVIV